MLRGRTGAGGSSYGRLERDAPATGGEQEQWLVGFLVRGAIAVAGGRVHLEGVKPFDGVIQGHGMKMGGAGVNAKNLKS